MSRLPDRSWRSIYESQPREEGTYLVDEFYVPALERSVQYDRIAGYFSSSALAVASRGIDALVENGGQMRLIVGAELYETDRPVLEALADELSSSLDELDEEQLDAQLQLLAYLLRENRLQIKIAVPRHGNWGIFHPKVGIFHDEAENILSFEGSVNETAGGWERNYERFKVHRSWIGEQAAYVDGDVDTFDRLWRNDHPYVEVYNLPEAIERELIQWKAPDSDVDVEGIIQIARGEAPPTERDQANIIADGPLSPGGLALAEQASTITPWPHQRVVSDTLINTYPNSFLLCDEVGLGKTIEAGLTLSRLGLTYELETGLLLVPASLAVQWQEELWEKFNLNAYRFDRGSSYEYVFTDAFGQEHEPPTQDELNLSEDEREEAWTASPIWRFIRQQQTTQTNRTPTIVIMSWHTARLKDRWNQVAPADTGRARTRDDTPASCRGRSATSREGVWDAVIVDEAHNAREGSNFYSLLERLRDHTQCYYLLTATPMQLHAGELYDLMALLDLPGRWDDQESFVEFFETRRVLNQALTAELDHETQSETDAVWSSQSTLDDRYQDRLPTQRTVSDRVLDAIATELEISGDTQPRAIAKQRVMTACRLAAEYGEWYDGYLEPFQTAIEEYDIDEFEAEDEKLKSLFYPEWKAEEEWLSFSRSERLAAIDELSPGGWRVVKDVLAESTPVDALIHRNTRDTLRKYEQVGLLDATVPDRNPEQREIDLTDETRRVYDRIDDYTRKFYKLAQQSSEADTRAIGFVMTTYRQRLTSSVYAISQSLQNRLKKLRGQRAVLRGKQRAAERQYGDSEQAILDTLSEYDLTDFEAFSELEGDLEDADISEIIPNVTDEGINLLDQEIDELESFVTDLKKIEHDPKISQLIDDLSMLDREGHNRVIVFTQYTDTMDFIRDRLISIHGETVATYSGRGGELYDASEGTWRGVGKERVKREFAADTGRVDILVCTDSASEGLNLQECGALINYDLPWNPMRVEQRIGRIDRIGQRYNEVTILNYSYKDTVETDIYERLDDRIGLFENVVGEMQPILSSVSQQIRDATLATTRDESNRVVEEADREFSKQIDDQEQDNRVDVKESLADVDTLVAQDVIDEAKLEAWQSYNHPDLIDVGETEYQYTPPYQSLEALLVGNETLAQTGIVFTPITDVEPDLTDGDYGEASKFEDQTYRLTFRDSSIEAPEQQGEQTLAEAIAADEGELAVTFSAECADEFPSVHYLAPGNPLLGQLINILQDASDDPTRLKQHMETRAAETLDPIVCAWGRDGSFARLSADGDVIEDQNASILPSWCEQFLNNRDRATNPS